jgi:hypothetical protein
LDIIGAKGEKYGITFEKREKFVISGGKLKKLT